MAASVSGPSSCAASRSTRSLQARGPLGAREAALVGLDVCAALAAVHNAGLLHRDVKAQNVMREAGGRIVLMDFGTGEDLAAAPAASSARRSIWRRRSSAARRRRSRATSTASASCSSTS